MRINKDDYFVVFLLFIFSLALFQCFVIPPVLYRSAPLFCGVSIVPAVFHCSDGIPLFRRCSGVQRVFRVPVVFLSAGIRVRIGTSGQNWFVEMTGYIVHSR